MLRRNWQMISDEKSHNRTKSSVLNIALFTYFTPLYCSLQITEQNYNPVIISHCTADIAIYFAKQTYLRNNTV
jgi:hypothetical protein